MSQAGADPAPPLVVAYPLGEAREALARAGWACGAVTVTAPPRRDGADVAASGPAEDMLVVRQQAAGGRAVRLTVARHLGAPQGG